MSSTGKSSSSSVGALAFTLLVALGVIILTIGCHSVVEAMQLNEADGGRPAAPSATLAVVENPEITARVLESLLRSVVYSATAAGEMQAFGSTPQKRGLDLGISRGFSGSQAGKHLMGLSAASFANGPGKR